MNAEVTVVRSMFVCSVTSIVVIRFIIPTQRESRQMKRQKHWRQGPSAPPLPTLAPRATVSESQRPARFTRERHTIAAESSHVSRAPTVHPSQSAQRTTGLGASYSASLVERQSRRRRLPPVPFCHPCRQRLFPPQKPTR
jgi:hypothetical protein